MRLVHGVRYEKGERIRTASRKNIPGAYLNMCRPHDNTAQYYRSKRVCPSLSLRKLRKILRMENNAEKNKGIAMGQFIS